MNEPFVARKSLFLIIFCIAVNLANTFKTLFLPICSELWFLKGRFFKTVVLSWCLLFFKIEDIDTKHFDVDYKIWKYWLFLGFQNVNKKYIDIKKENEFLGQPFTHRNNSERRQAWLFMISLSFSKIPRLTCWTMVRLVLRLWAVQVSMPKVFSIWGFIVEKLWEISQVIQNYLH